MNRKTRRYFDVLDIEPRATPEQVKQAYVSLAKIWHPDRFQAEPDLQEKAVEKMKEINQAYDAIKSWQGTRPKTDFKSGSSFDKDANGHDEDADPSGPRRPVPDKKLRNRVIALLILGAIIDFSFFAVSDSIREWASTPPPQAAGQQEYQRTSEEVVRKTRAAAERGERNAQLNLAHSLFHGRGVAPDRLEAVKWFRKAAEQGEVAAQLMLGACFFNGDGVPLDYASAAYWYGRAAERGEPAAQEMLGNLHEKGTGVAKNLAAAYKWFAAAASKGRPTAAAARDRVLAQLPVEPTAGSQGAASPQSPELAPRQPKDEIARLRAAAAGNDPRAQNQLGVAHLNGAGVVQNLTEAARWFRLAAEAGDPYAQANLGALLSSGRGMSMDHIEAYQWFNLAASQGHRTASSGRDAVARLMTPEQIAEAQRRSSEFIQRKISR